MKMCISAAMAISMISMPAAAGGTLAGQLIPIAQYSSAQNEGDLLEAAERTGAFATLLEAANSAGLQEELKGSGPFTVFAPTDAAFAKMPAGTVDSLLKPENRDQLISLLRMHVISGQKLTTADLEDQKLTAQTLNGPLAIDASDPISGVRVNNAAVTLSDIEASNGVIHAIDTVLLPAR